MQNERIAGSVNGCYYHQLVRLKLLAFVLPSSTSAFVLSSTSCSFHMLPSRPTNARIILIKRGPISDRSKGLILGP
jgi:hypothetical protein